MRVSYEAKLAVQRFQDMQISRRRRSRSERSAFERRFWDSWFQQYTPEHCKLRRIPTKREADKFRRGLRESPVPQVSRKGYDTALVDGQTQKIANFKIEAPGIFAGRGADHPLAGRVKRGLHSSNVTINISVDAVVPRPSDGGRWAAVIHDNRVRWLAAWNDPVSGKRKYMRLAGSSEQDLAKFDQARRVSERLPAMRVKLESVLQKRVNQEHTEHACCLSLIDQFALRVGGDGGGRVFGACTLRSDHLSLSSSKQDYRVTLEFPGKDSVQCVCEGQISKQLHNALGVCLQVSKRPSSKRPSSLFGSISDKSTNLFIALQFPGVAGLTGDGGVTSKNIRTARACMTYETCLLTNERKIHATPKHPMKHVFIALERAAAASVAILCNHRRVGSSDITSPDAVSDKRKLVLVIDTILKAYPTPPNKELRDLVRGLNITTSLGNYVDPRITRAFESRHGLGQGSCSSSALRSRLSWADGTAGGYRFSTYKR